MNKLTKKGVVIALSSMFVLAGSYPVNNSALKVLNPFVSASAAAVGSSEVTIRDFKNGTYTKVDLNGKTKIKYEFTNNYNSDALFYKIELPKGVLSKIGDKGVEIKFRNSENINYKLTTNNLVDGKYIIVPAKNSGGSIEGAVAIEITGGTFGVVKDDKISITKYTGGDKYIDAITLKGLSENVSTKLESDYNNSFSDDQSNVKYALIKPGQELIVGSDATSGARLYVGIPSGVGSRESNPIVVEHMGSKDVYDLVVDGKDPLKNKYNSDMYSKTEISSLSSSATTISTSTFRSNSSFYRITLKDNEMTSDAFNSAPVVVKLKAESTIGAPNTGVPNKPEEEKPQEPVKINANVYRHSGNNRYETSLNLSKSEFSRADVAVIASGRNYADALAGGPLAIAANAPLLLTDSSTTSIDAIKSELNRLGVKKIYFLGGLNSIDFDTQKAIESFKNNVESIRLEGSDRYATSYRIFKETTKYSGIGEAPVVVSGKNFADALAAGPVAGIENRAILLTDGKTLPGTVYSDSKDNIIIGGTNSVSTSIKGLRISGVDRYDTAANVAKYYFSGSKNAVLASGTDYPDGLSSITLFNNKKAPLILTKRDVLPTATRNMINKSSLKNIYVVGGENSVNSSVYNAVKGL